MKNQKSWNIQDMGRNKSQIFLWKIETAVKNQNFYGLLEGEKWNVWFWNLSIRKRCIGGGVCSQSSGAIGGGGAILEIIKKEFSVVNVSFKVCIPYFGLERGGARDAS